MKRFVKIEIFMDDQAVSTGEYLKTACLVLHQLDEQDLNEEKILFNDNPEILFRFTNTLNEEQRQP